MSRVTVAAKLVAKKECVAAVKNELLKLVEPTRHEAGCIEYRLHQDMLDPAVFLFYENWESPAHLERHVTTDHYTAYAAAVQDMLESKAVNKLSEIA